MAVFLSPGTFSREVDLSLYVANLSTTSLGMVGLATKGPINVPTYITDPVQFANNFGEPNTEFFGQYAALQFLHTGKQLWYVRVAEEETDPDLITEDNIYAAKFASTPLYESATKATVTTTSNNPVTFTPTTNKLTFVIDNVEPGFSVIFPLTSSSTKYTIPQIIATLNADTTFSQYLFASTNIYGYLLIERIIPGSKRSFKLATGTSTAKAVMKFPTAFQAGTAVVGTGVYTDRAFIASQASGSTVDTSTNTKLRFIVGMPVVNETVTISSNLGQLANTGIVEGESYITVDGELHGPDAAGVIKWPADNALLEYTGQTAEPQGLTVADTGDATEVMTFYIEIMDDVASPNTFRWMKGIGGTWTEDVAITGTEQTLSDGISVTFEHTTGYVGGVTPDAWTYTTQTVVSISSSGVVNPSNNLPDGDYLMTYAYGDLTVTLASSATLPLFSGTNNVVSALNTAFQDANYPVTASIMYEDVTLPANAPRLLISFDASADPLLETQPKVLQLGTPASLNATSAVFGTYPVLNGTVSSSEYLPTTAISSPVASNALTVQATSQGTWGNKLAISVDSVTSTTFDISVYEKGFVVERYKNLVKTPLVIDDPDNPGSTLPNPSYVENAINGVSSRITVTNPVISEDVYSTLIPNSTFLLSNIALSGGSDGAPAADSPNPSIYIGISDGFTKTGLQFFRNPEEMDINLIAVPGIYDAAVINEMIDICTNRADAMAIIDPPYGFTPQQVVEWRNGANTILAGGVVQQSDHQAFNSSYAALYWPWLQIYDPVNQQTVYTPPSGHVANVYAYTDYTSETWFAPAGLTRGRLATPIKAEYNPTLGERDLLYLNNINPIATFIRDGINVWGQKTLQTKPTALDRVNVRRLMLYLEKVIATAARVLLFEPNDAITWRRFVNLVEPYLDGVVARRGIVEYQVRCDSTTNTPDVIDRNEMVGIIFIKPTKAVEFLRIDFVLTAQGANFEELTY